MTLVLHASAAVALLLRTPKGLAVQAHVRDGLVGSLRDRVRVADAF